MQRRGRENPEWLTVQTSLAKELPRLENPDDCFLAPLGRYDNFDPALLDVEDRVRRVSVPLKGKKGLIDGIANENSIAYGCAEMLRVASADLAVTYRNATTGPFVRPLAARLGGAIMVHIVG